MPDYRELYATRADDYDRLIACEDVEQNVLRAIESLGGVRDLDLADIGAGTGRLAVGLGARGARSVHALDASAAMLEVAARRATAAGVAGMKTTVADNEHLTLASASVDVATAGWTFGHATGFYPDAWQEHIARSVDELLRIVRPGGLVVVLETLGTGSTNAEPPRPALAAYYAWLERERGFARVVLATDYVFPSVQEGARLVRFFFGDTLADRIEREQLSSLPERTGLWWRRA